MFNNYDNLYTKAKEYLSSPINITNIADYDNGFVSLEAFMAYVYSEIPLYMVCGGYSKDTHKVVFTTESIDDVKKEEEFNTDSFSKHPNKSFSHQDTMRKIGHYIIVNNSYYILTDYGVILINKKVNDDFGQIGKISKIRAWLLDISHNEEIERMIEDCLVEIPDTSKTKNLFICTDGNYSINTTSIEPKVIDCDIDKNYNDDMPYDKFMSLIASDEQELILLHGDPGTGKTTIIKKLVHDNPQTQFIYFDFKLLTSISNAKIFDFLDEHKNSVFIIEDCEKLFTNRNNGNQFLNTMLNLTDGIIGEAFKIKFICTFNCPTDQIDSAIMRKGRLSLIYKFEKLSLEKTKALIPSATEPMTLAQIYNTEDNGAGINNKRKIGF